MSSLIRANLSARWSPQQISRRLLTEHNMQVSHETIYQYIYVQTKGELKKELISYLRHRKSKRQSRKLVHEKRTTRFLLIVRLQGKDAESVRKAFSKAMKQLPESLTLSLTYDRGKEMAEHKKFTMDTKIKVYFCDPHSPWQRGTNENTNGLVRDFWPKGTDFSKIPTKQIVWVQNALNDRPRQTLNWETPRERMNKLICNQAETEG